MESEPDALPGLGLDEWETPPTPEQLSPGVRLTGKRREMIARGEHPVTHAALIRTHEPDDTRTCGDCGHLWRKEYTVQRHWWKCDLAESRGNNGPDVTKRWPACIYWTKREDDET
jgi:hypothetical protein